FDAPGLTGMIVDSPLFCPDDVRKALVRAQGSLNGIDYLELLHQPAPAGTPAQQTLLVRCLRPVGALTQDNVRIDGGVRVTNIRVLWALPGNSPDLTTFLTPDETALLTLIGGLGNLDRLLVVRTNRPGD